MIANKFFSNIFKGNKKKKTWPPLKSTAELKKEYQVIHGGFATNTVMGTYLSEVEALKEIQSLSIVNGSKYFIREVYSAV